MPTRSIEEILDELPTFSGLSEERLGLIAGCGRTGGFDPGEFLACEGDAADSFFVIRRGKVALEMPAPAEELVIATLGEGAIVGWSWLVPPHQWSFDVRALESTRTIVFDGACLRGKCEADPALGYELMRRFAGIILDRLQATRLQLLDVYGKPGED